MSVRKSDIAPRQKALLVVAAVVLVALFAVIGFTLMGQAPRGSSSNESSVAAANATPERTAEASNENADSADAGVDGDDETEDKDTTDEETEDKSSAGDDRASSSEPGAATDGGDTAPSGSSQSGSESESAPATIAVVVTIDGTKGGGGSQTQTVTINEGSTVFDALRATGAAIGGNSEYVRSINGLAEFQAGPNSGWFYYVDGVRPNFSCGYYVLSGGETIVWQYVEDWTKY